MLLGGVGGGLPGTVTFISNCDRIREGHIAVGQARDKYGKGNREFPTVQEHQAHRKMVRPKDSPYLSMDDVSSDKKYSPMGQSERQLREV